MVVSVVGNGVLHLMHLLYKFSSIKFLVEGTFCERVIEGMWGTSYSILTILVNRRLMMAIVHHLWCLELTRPLRQQPSTLISCKL